MSIPATQFKLSSRAKSFLLTLFPSAQYFFDFFF